MTSKAKDTWRPWSEALRYARSRAGLTQYELAKKALISRPQIGALENATRTPKSHHADSLDRALATGGVLRAMWDELSNNTASPIWFRDALMMERRAHGISAYHPILVPGELQSPGYARSLITARRIGASDEWVDQTVKTRCERLASLPERIWVVLDEVVITRVVGDETIMAEQLAHLLELIDSNRIRLQVIPASLRRHPGLCGPFRIYELPEGTVVHMEDSYGGTAYKEPDKVGATRQLFGALQGEGLAPNESAKFIREVKARL